MNETFNRIKEKALAYYNGLNQNRKIMLYVAVGVLVLFLTVVILFFTRTEYVEIARGLTPVEAQVITSKLEDLGIPWKDTGSTSVILVPKANASRARMEIAADVQASNLTWNDLIKNESITMTAQTREQMIIQINAANVKASIETLAAVERATVILQIPKESNYFIKDSVESKASVVLSLNRGYSLNEEQVSGIVNLIVSSVNNLSPENVTILDTTGVQLNNPNRLDSFSANSHYDLQYKVQKQLQTDLTSFLEKLYGVGNVEVQPRIVMDFNRQSETQRLFSPPIEGEITGMVRSATSIRENVVNSAGAVGVPGTDSNTGEATSVVEGSDGDSAYEKASETLNYELNEIYREIVKAQGEILDLSIGVLINSKAIIDGNMTSEHYNELVDLISKSAGTSKERIQVMVQEFPDPMALYDVYTGETQEGLLFGIPVWALVLVVLLTLAAVVAVMLMMKRKREKEAEALALEEARLKELETKQGLEEIDALQEDKGSPKYHIEKFVDTNPEAAVALLRAWLNE